MKAATQTSPTKNSGTSTNFNYIALSAFACFGLILVIFYFLAEIEEPEYLVYFAPILGLIFYCMYYVVNHKLDTSFLNGMFKYESNDF